MLNYLKRNETLTIISIEVVLMMMGIGIISPVLPQYARSFGVSITMIGLLITAFGAARLVVDIPAGRLSGVLGCRPILVSGPLIMAIGSLGSGLANNYWQLLAFQCIEGVGSALYTTAAMITLADISVPENRGRMMSLYQGSILLGASLGPVIGGFVAQYFGLRAPFFALSLFTFLAALWGYLRLPESRPPSSKNIMTAQRNAKSLPSNPVIGLVPLLRNYNFILISIVTFGVFVTRNGSQNQILPLLANDRIGLSEGQIGVAMTLIAVIQIGAIILGGRLSDRYGRKAIIVPGCCFTAIALLLISQSYSYGFLLLSCVFMGVGMGTSGPTPAAYVADIISKDNYANSMGLFRAMGDVGFVVGPALLGWLADMRGLSFSLIFNGLFVLFTAILFQLLAQERRKLYMPHEAPRRI